MKRFRILRGHLTVVHADGDVQDPAVCFVYDRENGTYGLFFPEADPASPLAGLVFFVGGEAFQETKEFGVEVERLVLSDWRKS